jgi:hypothetical protein
LPQPGWRLWLGLGARSAVPESQPGAAHHAFEVFEDIAPATASQAVRLCDWLASITHDDGGLPFAMPLTLAAGSGPWWSATDLSVSSLQITTVTAAAAHRVATDDQSVAAHPWLARATDYCLREIDGITRPPFAYVLAFSIRFLDALHDTQPDRAAARLGRLAEFVPSDGKVHVTGGTAEETLTPLDLAPFPNRPARQLFAGTVIATDLDRLAALQQKDGGWIVDYLEISPAGSLDWRGHATVRALDILLQNGRLGEDVYDKTARPR